MEYKKKAYNLIWDKYEEFLGKLTNEYLPIKEKDMKNEASK